MSEIKLISPMLDGFSIGEAFSSHNGVSCYPALKGDQEDKYIVKIVSVPESQVQLAALQLTGAYSNRTDALQYYKTIAQDILQEVRIMNELGNLEGFIPYLRSQLYTKEDDAGYDIYLLSKYQQSLAQILATDVMTHQRIIQLGLDICAALSACRRAGYLYVDLKPDNIFYSRQEGYRIGDLGFISLHSLKYASLPDKYRSVYTAREIVDAGSELNATLDVYALGLILYAAYNGGHLPIQDDQLVRPLLPPIYADYEMSAIILTACAPDPQQRWQDPTQLAQALVEYMQRNEVSDSPIIPPPVSTPELDAGEDFLPEEPISELDDWANIPELSFMQELVSDDTAPTLENTKDLDMSCMSDETSEMLAQADALLAHEPPPPVIPPEPVEIPDPKSVLPEPPEQDEPVPTVEEIFQKEEHVSAAQPFPEELPFVEGDLTADVPVPQFKSREEAASEARRAFVPPVRKTRNDRRNASLSRIVPIVIIVLIAAVVIGGIYYYSAVYVRNIDDLVLTGTETEIFVQIRTDCEESLLLVSCTDTYGNTFTSDVSDGKASFSGLSPRTRYTIRVLCSGNHKLTGATSDSFLTPGQTNILDFSARIGPVDGAVTLNFVCSSAGNSVWNIAYGIDSAEEKNITFTGNSITIYDLEIGATYHFTLSVQDQSAVIGQTEIQYTVNPIVMAENPTIVINPDGTLNVQWDVPGGKSVDFWTVRCYNDSGYDRTVTTRSTEYTFTGLVGDTSCTVEIFAAGMDYGATAKINE